VQFTDDPALAEAVKRAEEIELEEVRLRVISHLDLLHKKLRAATDPARRRSKRLQDFEEVLYPAAILIGEYLKLELNT